jgi:hypothetical protein
MEAIAAQIPEVISSEIGRDVLREATGISGSLRNN